jgi:hypothetical protein
MKLAALVFIPVAAFAQEKAELIGKVGTRSALLTLHSAERADGSRQVAGEYVILPTLVRRYVEGERSPELGVTVLKEGTAPILFGRPGTAELRGTWRDGAFKGARFGPGGQRREEFEFTEEFPALDNYSATVRCEAKDGRYESRLALAIDKGALKSLEWRSLDPDGQVCTVNASEQQPMRGGLRFVAGACRVTLRDVGPFLALRAESCAAHCEMGTLFIDRRGHCELLP